MVVFVLSTAFIGLSLLLSLYGQMPGNVTVVGNVSHLQLFVLALAAEILETVILFTILSSSV